MPGAGTVRAGFCKSSVLFLTFYLFLFIPLQSFAAEPIVVAVTLNQESHGDFFVILQDDGDFWIRTDDLSAMGKIGRAW